MRDQAFKPIKAPKRTPRPLEVSDAPPTPSEVKRGIAALRRVLHERRWASQGGFPGYEGNGRWSFISTSISGITPSEMNALLALAGIVPDKIEIIGRCGDCANSQSGFERGYVEPCVSCLRPSHINNFVPYESIVRRGKKRGT